MLEKNSEEIPMGWVSNWMKVSSSGLAPTIIYEHDVRFTKPLVNKISPIVQKR